MDSQRQPKKIIYVLLPSKNSYSTLLELKNIKIKSKTSFANLGDLGYHL